MYIYNIILYICILYIFILYVHYKYCIYYKYVYIYIRICTAAWQMQWHLFELAKERSAARSE